jgi:RNA polymerase sigma-70 factor (ECF subfamily)
VGNHDALRAAAWVLAGVCAALAAVIAIAAKGYARLTLIGVALSAAAVLSLAAAAAATVALRLAGSEALAEDLTQETMLKAFRAWNQYERGTNARAWLLTILRHTFINQYRKAQRSGVHIDIGEIESFSVFREVQDVDPEGRFFDQLVDDEVVRAIDSLPDEFRETLVLSDVEGLPYQEIAKITEVPVGTVKSRLFRARQALQKVLYDYAVEMGYIKGKAEE